MKRNKFGIDLINKTQKKVNYIILISILLLIYQMIYSNFDIQFSVKSVLIAFLFGTFISYIYTTFLNLYKPTSFFTWWWKIYGFTVLFKIIVNHI